MREFLKKIRGISFLEAVLVLPLLLILLLAAVDLVWYVTVYVFLSYGANMAVDYASKIPVEIDTTQDGCQSNPTQCAAYLARVDDILNKAEQIALMVAAPAYSGPVGVTRPAKVQLIPFRMYENSIYTGGSNNSGINSMDRNSFFLRPGEMVLRDHQSRYGASADENHPLRVFGTGGNQGWPQPQYNEDWEILLRDFPLAVGFYVQYQSFLPFIPPLTIKVVQYAYRRVPPPALAAAPFCGNGICEISEIGPPGVCCVADCATCPGGGVGGSSVAGSAGVTGTGATGTGVTGSGVTGSGVTGSGVTGIGVAGSGVAGTGVTGTGVTGTGVTGTGVTGTGVTGTGVTGTGVTGTGVTGTGVTGTGVTGTGVTGTGVTGTGVTGTGVTGTGVTGTGVTGTGVTGTGVTGTGVTGTGVTGTGVTGTGVTGAGVTGTGVTGTGVTGTGVTGAGVAGAGISGAGVSGTVIGGAGVAGAGVVGGGVTGAGVTGGGVGGGAFCGDGSVNVAGEECDPPGSVCEGGANIFCQPDCTCAGTVDCGTATVCSSVDDCPPCKVGQVKACIRNGAIGCCACLTENRPLPTPMEIL